MTPRAAPASRRTPASSATKASRSSKADGVASLASAGASPPRSPAGPPRGAGPPRRARCRATAEAAAPCRRPHGRTGRHPSARGLASRAAGVSRTSRMATHPPGGAGRTPSHRPRHYWRTGRRAARPRPRSAADSGARRRPASRPACHCPGRREAARPRRWRAPPPRPGSHAGAGAVCAPRGSARWSARCSTAAKTP